MEKIINEIMEWCQNDYEYLKELINALQEIVTSEEQEYVEERGEINESN